MPAVNLALSGLRGGIDVVAPLMSDVAAAFAPFGIGIENTINQVLTRDPEEMQDGWLRLVSQLQQQSQMQSPAHLVVTDAAPGFDGTIDGMLLDTAVRGVVAIYLGANVYGSEGPAQRPDLVSQICIHEVGHLLNLTHGDGADGDYSNAMLASTVRLSQRLDEAWDMAITDAASRGEDPLESPQPVLYYPFNAQCRANLRAATDDPLWLPFNGPFRGDLEGAGANEDRHLQIEVHPHGDATSVVGGGIYATLQIRNVAQYPIELPAHIAPEHGTVRVFIEGDAPQPFVHRPQQLFCSSARRMLMPGQLITRPLAIVGREGSPLFSSPGEYRCTFELCDTRTTGRRVLGRRTLDVTVQQDGERERAARYLSALVNPARVRLQSQRIQTRRLDRSPLAYHTVLAEARRVRSLKDRIPALRMCLRPDAPNAIRHQAAKSMALHRIRRGEPWRDISDDFSRTFSEPLHHELHNAIRRMGEGWTKHRTERTLRAPHRTGGSRKRRHRTSARKHP